MGSACGTGEREITKQAQKKGIRNYLWHTDNSGCQAYTANSMATCTSSKRGETYRKPFLRQEQNVFSMRMTTDDTDFLKRRSLLSMKDRKAENFTAAAAGRMDIRLLDGMHVNVYRKLKLPECRKCNITEGRNRPGNYDRLPERICFTDEKTREDGKESVLVIF